MNKLRMGRRLITAADCAWRFAGLLYRAGVLCRHRGSGVVRSVVVAGALLAAFGVLGVFQPAALASSSPVLNWTRQAPTTSPSARSGAAMAYDAATRNIVLFGGSTESLFRDTWVWNGSTWTKQHPATIPPARSDASMAYDAANHTVVMFGGLGSVRGYRLGDTWVWNGSTWTKQSPATHPSARLDASMAYDAATGNIVLFGGTGRHSSTLADTWVWNGSTWTKQSPATSPSAGSGASMAYDAATGNIVLFGGTGRHGTFADTWVWNGSTWTKQSPATHASARSEASMAYDAATGNIVLFGGFGGFDAFLSRGTWVWNGSTWTKQSPATHPSARSGASMAYDAATGNVVLFGGLAGNQFVNDTWTWGSD